MANRGSGKSLAVQERRREYLQVVLPEQADDQVGIRIYDVEPGDKGGHVAHPNAVHVGVRDGDDMVVVDPFRVERPLDHLVPLARRERILSCMAVLRRTDPDDDLAVRLEDPLHHGEVAAVKRLEPTDEEGAAGHSSSSPRKWPIKGQSSVRNFWQWTHRPSSSCAGSVRLDS